MPLIEEIDDDAIDNMDYDPADFDTNNPFDKSMPVEGARLRPVSPPAPQARPNPSSSTPAAPRDVVDTESLQKMLKSENQGRDIPEHMKSWKVLYPCYFDAARSVSEGRRAPKEIAVKNPLATRLVEACQSLGVEVAFELTKVHPKDWANPGRVRIDYKGSKRKLYAEICQYLTKNPTTEKNASVGMYRQIAQFDSPHPLAVPKGMKINEILPGVSPAVSCKNAIKESMNMDGMGAMGKMFGM